MSEAIHYCDRCARLIPPSTVRDGSAFVDSTKSLCRDCLCALPAGQRAHAGALAAAGDGPGTGPQPAAASESARAHTAFKSQRMREQSSTRALSPKIALVAAILGAGVAVLVVIGPRDTRRAPVPPRPAAAADAAAADGPAVTAAAQQLAKMPWLKEAGEAKIAAAIDEIEKRRAASQPTEVTDVPQHIEPEQKPTPIPPPGGVVSEDSTNTGVAMNAVPAPGTATGLAEGREAILAEFDRLMTGGEYAAARDHVQSKAIGGGPDAEILLAAARVAGQMVEASAARMRGAKTLVGREVRLKLATGQMTAIVKAATDAGLAVAATFTVNNETRERALDLKWDALHAEQKAQFARLGGLEMPPADAAVGSAYEALATDDIARARSAVEAAGDHPLAGRLAEVVRERQTQHKYESAVKRAQELVARRSWKVAVEECEKALDLRPGDGRASELLAEARRHIEPEPTLTLELAPGVTMELVHIKPGVFTMGGDMDSKYGWVGVEKPKHEVAITRGFYLGKYEVTQAQYEAVMGGNPSSWKEANRPVEQVSWTDAAEFCRRASEKTRREVRLPTEAEWEYACRAGTTTDWSHGNDSATLGEYAWYLANADRQTHPVGEKKPNAWGLYDMHGNVWEWVADWYSAGYYASSPREDPPGPAGGDNRLLRGGGWYLDGSFARSASRRNWLLSDRHSDMGLRAAVSLPPRGGRPQRDASPAAVAGPAERPATAAPAPRDAGDAAVANLVVNGGFETRDAATRFASGWRTHVWGEADNAASIRLDKANAHTGENAMAARAHRDGAKPGAFASVKLEPGTYEVSYWAQADVGERAQVGAHLGGVDLQIRSVGEEWTRFTERVEIEKRHIAAGLKLWVQTRKVRVWFDDVEVRLISAKKDCNRSAPLRRG